MATRRHSAGGFHHRFLFLVLLLVLGTFRIAESAPHRRGSHQGTLRLCSRNLSDALYLICRDRGYNEPFSYSSEDEPRVLPGPGLVEECCYHSCSYDQLEQYCKPSSEEKRSGSRDVIENSYGIVPLPRSSARRESSLEEDSRIEYVDGAIKRKIHHGAKKSRKRGHTDHEGGCIGIKYDHEAASKRDSHDRCQRRRRRRRRPGKVQHEKSTSKSNVASTSRTKASSSKSLRSFEESANDSSISS